MADKQPERSLEERGDNLSRRLKEARRGQDGPGQRNPRLKNETSGLGQAFRIGTELVSALIVGVILGWWLDDLLGTSPWLKIIFIVLGIGAGILNVYRTGMRMAEDLHDSAPLDATNGIESDQSARNSAEK